MEKSENSTVPIIDNEKVREVIQEGLNAKLWTAFSKAQGQFRTPKLNRTAKVFKEKVLLYETHYADLEEIIDCIRKPLADNGLSFVQKVATDNGHWALILQLRHELGGYDESILPLNVNQTNQQLGSTLTYLKRYQASAYFGLAADFDDDANGSVGNEAQFSDKKQSTAPKTQQAPPKEKAKPKVTSGLGDPSEYVMPIGRDDVKGKKLKEIPEKRLKEIQKWAYEKIHENPPPKDILGISQVYEHVNAFLESVGAS